MGPQQARLQPDGLLEELGALREALLPKANRSEHRSRPRPGSPDRKGPAAPAARLPPAAPPGPGRRLVGGHRSTERQGRRPGPQGKAQGERPQAATPRPAGRPPRNRPGPPRRSSREGRTRLASASGSVRPLGSVVEPHTQLNRSCLVGLTAHQAESTGAEVRVRSQEGRPVEDVAELRLEPQPRAFGELEALRDVDVFVEDLEPARVAVTLSARCRR